MHDLGLIAVTRSRRREKKSAALKLYVGGGSGRRSLPGEAVRFLRPAGRIAAAGPGDCHGSLPGSARRRIATGRASSFWFRTWGSRNSRNWFSKSARRCPPIRAGRITSTQAPKSSRKRRCGRAANGRLWFRSPRPRPSQRWLKTNTRPQKQAGYVTVTVALPLGDITANQLRSLADIVRRFTKETIRTTVEQNFVIRWVSSGRFARTLQSAGAVGLGDPGAGTIVDIVACPGTDTCKLGISSSRGLAAELRKRMAEKSFQLDEAVQNLHIKISGCFNSCGQHHVADLGFYGVSRKIAGYAVPHFQVVLGGEWEHNAGSYGLPVAAVPSKNIPQVVTRLTERYVAERKSGETFKDFIKRIGKVELKKMLEDLTRPPAGRPFILLRLGRSARIQPGRHGRRRMRRRSRFRRRL